MIRQKLIGIVRDAAVSRTYAFHTGEVHELNGTIGEFPAAWLEPVSVVGVTGREEGEITCRVVLHLATAGATSGKTDDNDAFGRSEAFGDSGATNESSEQWAGLERDARCIVSDIASDGAVLAVTGVSCVPARQSLSVHGEESVTLKCDVKMWYAL